LFSIYHSSPGIPPLRVEIAQVTARGHVHVLGKEMNEWAGNVELQQDFSTYIQPRRKINLVVTASG